MHIRDRAWPYAGLANIRPKWQRRFGNRHGEHYSSKGIGLRVWVLLILSAAATAYFVWQKRPLPAATTITAPAAAGAPAKLDTPAALPLPGEKPGSRELIARAQLANELLYTDLQSFVCNEQIQRYKGTLEGDKAHQIDIVTSKVSFENGIEHYSEIRQNNHQRAAMSNLPGAWSEGEFGTLLRQTRALLSSQTAALKGQQEIEGTAAAEYSILVPEAESPWNLVIGSHSYTIPFETDVWISKDSGQILKIERDSTQMPPETGIAELRWSVILQPTPLEQKTWLLPRSGVYEVRYAASDRREWNVMNFTGYRRYGAQTILHF